MEDNMEVDLDKADLYRAYTLEYLLSLQARLDDLIVHYEDEENDVPPELHRANLTLDEAIGSACYVITKAIERTREVFKEYGI